MIETTIPFFDQALKIVSLSHFLSSQVQVSFWELVPIIAILVLIGFGISQMSMPFQWNGANAGHQRHARKSLAVPMSIKTPVTQEFVIRTTNISVSGAFISYGDLQSSMTFVSLVGRRNGIRVGDLVDVIIYTSRFQPIKCQARVVRYNFDKKALPPMGIGIEFIRLSSRHQRALSNYLAKQQSKEAA